MTIDFRNGAWQEALSDVEAVDAVICDPPYSKRTHKGIGTGWHPGGKDSQPYECAPIVYDSWEEDHAVEFVRVWSPRTRGWMVVLTDHETAIVLQREMRAAGRYAFAPVPFVELGKQPRVHGDGPASWTCWIVVARPREKRFMSWGSLPGAYIPPVGQGVQSDRFLKGGKPLWLMRALVRDYSRRGELVCDPFAGGGTTLLAAAIEGRKALGSEMDPQTHALAERRIAKGFTPALFDETPGQSKSHQLALRVISSERRAALLTED